MVLCQINEGNAKIKGEVLDQISYEVKESLNSIIGFSNIIKNSCLDPKQKEQINNVLISSEQLLKLANNISGLSKLISGKYETNSYPFSTEKLLNEIINSFESISQKKEINFKLKISEVKITNDYRLISQIIYSLIHYLTKISTENNSIIIKNTATAEGVLVEIETDITKFINQKKSKDLNDILNAEDNCCENLDFYLTKHLLSLINGQILFSNPTNYSSKIQVYIPSKIA